MIDLGPQVIAALQEALNHQTHVQDRILDLLANPTQCSSPQCLEEGILILVGLLEVKLETPHPQGPLEDAYREYIANRWPKDNRRELSAAYNVGIDLLGVVRTFSRPKESDAVHVKQGKEMVYNTLSDFLREFIGERFQRKDFQ